MPWTAQHPDEIDWLVSLKYQRNGDTQRPKRVVVTDAGHERQFMNYMDDPFSRDLKRIEVARRMVSHQVSTQTIVDYTGLTRNRLATLRRRWCVAEDSRRRGLRRRSIGVLLRTPVLTTTVNAKGAPAVSNELDYERVRG